jgi:transposase InsO family protein
VDQKRLFIKDYLRGTFAVTDLCARYEVSRKTGYKWIDRFEELGPPGLEDRSRRPLTSPTSTPQEIVDRILELRDRHPHWGAKKLLSILRKRHPKTTWPARSTVCDILKRNGKVTQRRRRSYPGHGGRPTTPMNAPNDIWCADFKGHFRTLDGVYCYPLTISDGCTRYLLACQALDSTAEDGVKPVFTRTFKEFGLPLIIRTDNGVPFATTALLRLSRLSAWWIRLGIYPELIQPGHPEQNGRHERMHRTLKAETTRPAAGSKNAQQRRFNAFRAEYNEVRPHEALGQETPASVYTTSPREFPSRLPAIVYPDHFELRLVSRDGGIRFQTRDVWVSKVLEGQYVGLEEVGDGVWDVRYGPVRLGQFDERHYRVEDARGRRFRSGQGGLAREVLPMSPD